MRIYCTRPKQTCSGTAKVVEVKVRDVLIKSGRVPTKSEVSSLASHDELMSHRALINQFLSHEILHLLWRLIVNGQVNGSNSFTSSGSRFYGSLHLRL